MTGSHSIQSRIQKEIEELTTSVSGLIENFHRLKNPLVESRERVPQATNQLDKISQQTEAATHRVLDIIEAITQREEQVVAGLSQISQMAANGNTVGVSTLADTLQDQANTTLNDAFTIMEALQFQDITSQQMNHAASLLEDIEAKLQNILHIIGGEEFKQDMDTFTPKKERAFDPHADLFERRTQQADIDSLFSRSKTK